MPPLPNNRVSIAELRGYVEDGYELEKYVNSSFDELDANSDGKLSKDELRPAILNLTEIMGLPKPDSKEGEDVLIDEVFKSLFSDDLGAEIDRDTFITISKEIFSQIVGGNGLAFLKAASDGAAVRSLLAENDDILATVDVVFKELDRDNSGQLDTENVTTALQALGLENDLSSGTETDVSKLIPKYSGGKPYLEKEEFLHLLQDVLGRSS